MTQSELETVLVSHDIPQPQHRTTDEFHYVACSHLCSARCSRNKLSCSVSFTSSWFNVNAADVIQICEDMVSLGVPDKWPPLMQEEDWLMVARDYL